MNRLVRALQGEPQLASNSRDVGYLPHASHPRFDQLCEDWLAILAKDMPIYDALEHLTERIGRAQDMARTSLAKRYAIEAVRELELDLDT